MLAAMVLEREILLGGTERIIRPAVVIPLDCVRYVFQYDWISFGTGRDASPSRLVASSLSSSRTGRSIHSAVEPALRKRRPVLGQVQHSLQIAEVCSMHNTIFNLNVQECSWCYLQHSRMQQTRLGGSSNKDAQQVVRCET